MSKGDWRLYAAFGLIVGILAAGVFGNPKGANPNPNPSTQSGNQPIQPVGLGAAHIRVAAQPPRLGWSNDCYHGKNDEDYKRCLEGESLRAAKDSAGWTFGTVIVGIIGTGAVIGSLVLSAWAAKAASNAARSADETLKSNRAWLMPVGVQTKIITKGRFRGALDVSVIWKNCGNTPALNILTGYSFAGMRPEALIQELSVTPDTVERRGNVGPGESFIRSIAFGGMMYNTPNSEDGCMDIYVHASYRDVFNPDIIRQSETRLRIKYDPEREKKNRFSVLPIGPKQKIT